MGEPIPCLPTPFSFIRFQTFYLLATHPEVQAQLRAEVSPVFMGNRPDYKTLNHLPVLEGVVYSYSTMTLTDILPSIRLESLRLHPPVPLTVRRAVQDDYVDGIFVPKGTMIGIQACLSQFAQDSPSRY